jgi:hypothetical protein
MQVLQRAVSDVARTDVKLAATCWRELKIS